MMKTCIRSEESKFSLKLISSSMLENQIKDLKMTRSCPTGYDEREIRGSPTVELLHLRKTAFEYLNMKSSKTRNIQFVLLVGRINKELERRKVNIPVSSLENNFSCIPTSNCEGDFDEISHYMQNLNRSDKGEYCFLTQKIGYASKELVLDSMVLCNSHFSFSKYPQTCFPSFLHDRLKDQVLMNKSSSSLEFCNTSTTEVSKDTDISTLYKDHSRLIRDDVDLFDISKEVGYFDSHNINIDEEGLLLFEHN